MKPVAYDIDTSRRNLANLPKPGGFAIKYKCPHCGLKFNYFIDYKELNYCYSCGQSLFWGGCIAYLNSRMSDSYKDLCLKNKEMANPLKEGLISMINKDNEICDSAEMVYLTED